MNRLVRTFALAALAALLCGCTYEQSFSMKDTPLHFIIEECKGTQAVISVVPEDDRVYFEYDIMDAAELDDIEAHGLQQEYLRNVVEESRELYREFVESEKRHGHHYIASYSDYFLYYAHARETFTGLSPETDYYVVGYCADPLDGTPLGPYQKMRFTTTAILPTPSDMELKFMLHGTADSFHYYVKPTLDGKICREFYLADIVSDEVLYAPPYDGDINKYGYMKYLEFVSLGTLTDNLRKDITRTTCDDVFAAGEGKGYTVFGAPFNINNIDKLFYCHFTYRHGMYQDYSNNLTPVEGKGD